MHDEKKLKELSDRIEHRIKKKMVDENISQAALARKIGVNRSQICRAIKGDSGKTNYSIRMKIYRELDMRSEVQ